MNGMNEVMWVEMKEAATNQFVWLTYIFSLFDAVAQLLIRQWHLAAEHPVGKENKKKGKSEWHVRMDGMAGARVLPPE